MRLNIEIPDDWDKTGKKWDSTQLMSCNQCEYKTPNAALYVTHVYSVHGVMRDEITQDTSLTTAP